MNHKVSIVIPAYNIADYIGACIESVLKQTYKNTEIIVVDDGSTDNTPTICDKYKKQNPQLIVIHQKNAGLSGARNRGLKESTGSYICFIDGDDMIDENYIELLLQSINENSSEIAVCGYKTVSDTETVTTHPASLHTISGKEACIKLMTEQLDFDVLAWNKLYKKSVFTKNQIKYPVGKIHEDNLTTYKTYAKADKVSFISDAPYNYMKREGSITSNEKRERQVAAKIEAAKEAIDYLSYDEELKDSATFSLFLAYIIGLNLDIQNRKNSNYRKLILDLNIDKNRFAGKKAKVYAALIKPLNGMSYRLFRKVIDLAK